MCLRCVERAPILSAVFSGTFRLNPRATPRKAVAEAQLFVTLSLSVVLRFSEDELDADALDQGQYGTILVVAFFSAPSVRRDGCSSSHGRRVWPPLYDRTLVRKLLSRPVLMPGLNVVDVARRSRSSSRRARRCSSSRRVAYPHTAVQ